MSLKSEETTIKSTDKTIRYNETITAKKVRLVDQDGNQSIVNLEEALLKAKSAEMDLVEISPNAQPPVCKIMNYGKFVFENRKRKAAQKKKQKKTQIKEIKLRPTTDEGDLRVKVRSIVNFLEEGDKVKVTVRFRGREMMHPELAMNLLKRIETDIANQGVIEQHPKFEGKQIVMLIGPKK